MPKACPARPARAGGHRTIHGNSERGTGILNNELYFRPAGLEQATVCERPRDRQLPVCAWELPNLEWIIHDVPRTADHQRHAVSVASGEGTAGRPQGGLESRCASGTLSCCTASGRQKKLAGRHVRFSLALPRVTTLPKTETRPQRDYRVKELCERYLTDADNGLRFWGKGVTEKAVHSCDRPWSVRRHIIPLMGTRLVKDVTSPRT